MSASTRSTRRPDSPDAWDRFRVVLTDQMKREKVTSLQLANLLGHQVSVDTVNNWRKGNARPKLDLLPIINKVLRFGADPNSPAEPADPTYLYRRMGLLAEGTSEDAYLLADRLQRLDHRLREAIERSATFGRDYGVSAIFTAARLSQEYAVAVWPAYEGPVYCRMHVADRIDIKRIDGRTIRDEEVFAHQDLRRALRDAYAFPANRQPRWADPNDRDVSRWAISHIGAPTSPVRRLPHPKAHSVLNYSVTVESWANDVASLLASAIGYGHTLTRDLAMEVTGVSSPNTNSASRSQAHAALLGTPPRHRVWSHHAPPDRFSPNPFACTDPTIPIVWLREDDGLLELASSRTRAPLAVLMNARAEVEKLTATVPNPLLIINQQDLHHDTAARWAQTIDAAAQVFNWLEAQAALASDTRSAWSVPDTSRRASTPFLRWLAAGTPRGMPER